MKLARTPLTMLLDCQSSHETAELLAFILSTIIADNRYTSKVEQESLVVSSGWQSEMTLLWRV